MGSLLDCLSHFVIVLTLLQVWAYHLYAVKLSSISSKDVRGSCNLYEGSWVYNERYPLYSSTTCPFIAAGRACASKTDKEYLKYKWKPNTCNLPWFDAIKFLNKFKGKRLMFVGDSIGQNQWMSLACLIHAQIPNSKYNLVTQPQLSTVTFDAYQSTLIYSENRFLVDLVYEPSIGRVLKLDSISPNTTQLWRTADILIFNSFHWWTHINDLQTWDYFEHSGQYIKSMDHMEAYYIGLETWANWIVHNIDPNKVKVFYQGISALHLNGQLFGESNVKNCVGQTKPIFGSNFPGTPYPGQKKLQDVLSTLKTVSLLNITLMTQLRPDGHPEMYQNNIDCSHFCVPGVPDAWNELLYTALIGQ